MLSTSDVGLMVLSLHELASVRAAERRLEDVLADSIYPRVPRVTLYGPRGDVVYSESLSIGGLVSSIGKE